jgi:hypothetical protein
MSEAARFYLQAGENGNPDAFYNLSLLVEAASVPCPGGWTAQKLAETAKTMGCASAKSAWVQARVAVIDSLTAAQLEELWSVAWEAFVEAPEVVNHSFFLGCLYVPTEVNSDVPRHFDLAKAVHFLQISQRLDPNESRDSLLQNIRTAYPIIPAESSPTISVLTQQAEKRVLDFKIRQLRTVVSKWTRQPASPQLMVYCRASMAGAGAGAGAGSEAPTNAVVFASLLSKSLDRDSNDTPTQISHSSPLTTQPLPASKDKGAPHLVEMTSADILKSIESFHAKRVKWGFPTDPTDFPFRLPDINGPFSEESLAVLTPVLLGA